MTVPAFEPGRKWDRSDETEPEPSEWFPWTIHGLRLGREPAGVMDSVLDRRTVLRITDTPGKKSRWPPRRRNRAQLCRSAPGPGPPGAQAGRGARAARGAPAPRRPPPPRRGTRDSAVGMHVHWLSLRVDSRRSMASTPTSRRATHQGSPRCRCGYRPGERSRSVRQLRHIGSVHKIHPPSVQIFLATKTMDWTC